MKRISSLVVFGLALVLASSVLWAATQPEKTAKTTAAAAPGAALAATFSQITGVAISPLLGVSAVGAYTWFRTPAEKKASLPWYAHPSFWLVALLVVAAVALKDSLGAVLPPGWKKPLDVAETLENKLSGAVAVGAFVPFSVDSLMKLVGIGHVGAIGSPLMASGLATIQVGAVDFSWALTVLTMPLAAAIFIVVWITSHAINVLILLSPWGAVDAALKGFRLTVLSLLTITATIDPKVGAILSLIIVVAAWFCAGWAFRLTVFGTIFCWDFFTLRRARFRPRANDNRMFTARNVGGAPIRSYGRLHRGEDGKLEFQYRPWLVFPRRTAEIPPAGLTVGRGVFYSTLVTRSGDDETTLFLLPPRYRGHETDLANAYAMPDVIDIGLRRAWGWLKEALGFKSRNVRAAAA
jgi:MFS family permease